MQAERRRCNSAAALLVASIACGAPLLLAGSTGCDGAPASTDPIRPLAAVGGESHLEPVEVEVIAGIAVACTALEGLVLYDVSLPERVQPLGSTGFSLGSGIFPRCQHVAGEPGGGRLYVASHTDQVQPQPFLAVIDATDPSRPREIGATPLAEQVEGLSVHGGLLLVAAHDDGLLVFRRESGAGLTRLAQLQGLGNAWTVRARGSLAYVASADGALTTVDIGEPAAPKLVSRLELPGAPRDLVLSRDRAFLALGMGGIAAVSLREPRRPVLTERVATPGSTVSVAVPQGEPLLYVADWSELRVYDTRGDALRLLGREPVPIPGLAAGRTLSVAALGRTLIAAKWTEVASYRVDPRAAPDLDVATVAVEPPPVAAAVSDLVRRSGSAPGWVFDRTEGGTLPARDRAAKATLLVYFATYCPVCNHEFTDLARLDRELGPRGLRILGVSIRGIGGLETAEQLRAFARQTGARFPLVWDRGSFEAVAWPEGVSPFPRQLLLDETGRAAYLSARHDPHALRAAVEALLAEATP